MIYHVPPENAGQMVEVAYASDGEFFYRRTTDHSDYGTSVTERVSIDSLDGTVEWSPWNVAPTIDEADWELAQ